MSAARRTLQPNRSRRVAFRNLSMHDFTEVDVRAALDPDALIAALRAAFARGFGELRMPPRTRMELAPGCILLLMPCYDAAANAAGVKIVSVSPAGVHASYFLLDAQ